MRKIVTIVNLVILVSLTTAEPCSAQLGRGGLIRRLFGRNIQEEGEDKKEDKEKADKEDEPENEPAISRKKKAGSSRASQQGTPTPAPPQKSSSAPNKSRSAASPNSNRNEGFGLTTKPFTSESSKGQPISGLSVQAVEKGSAADKAEIAKGDQLLLIAGSPIDESFSLSGLEAVLAKGDLIEVELLRKNRAQKVNLTVQEDGVLLAQTQSKTNPALALTRDDNFDSTQNSGLKLEDFTGQYPGNNRSPASRSPLPLVPSPTAKSPTPRSILESVEPIEVPSARPKSSLQQTIKEQAAIIREQNAEIERLRALLRR
ncbi:MAG: PDZ domain-containing protein [Aureliella sp.]